MLKSNSSEGQGPQRRGLLKRAPAALGLLAVLSGPSPAQTLVLEDSLLVAMVPAGFPVGFDLLSQGTRQYLAYYDSAHNMVVASREVGERTFTRKVLPSRVGWDSHNSVTQALDSLGHLHVSGNMHGVPLVYFRTTTAGSVATLAAVPNMVSRARENRVTYPRFLTDAQGVLHFFYRLGGSGDGIWYFNQYEAASQTWTALHGGQPLFGNAGSVNAYFRGPFRGPDGRWHVSYLWRDTPDAATCHDISYIRTRGNSLDAWETVQGKALTLPVVSTDSSAVADPVAARAGLINSVNALGFDSKGRAVLSYHKYDAQGVSQLYNARWSETERRWQVVQASRWTGYKWDFGGNGTIGTEIGVEAVEPRAGRLEQNWRHSRQGSGRWVLDEETLLPVDPAPKVAAREAAALPELAERTAWDRGATDEAGVRYALRWRTLPPNRDVKPDSIPPDSRLMLLKFRQQGSSVIAVPPAGVPKAARERKTRLRYLRPPSAGGGSFDGNGRSAP